MNSLYKTFLHKFQAETIGKGMSVSEVAKLMCVHPKTVYEWFRKRCCMDGDSVVRAIHIMGGYDVHERL